MASRMFSALSGRRRVQDRAPSLAPPGHERRGAGGRGGGKDREAGGRTLPHVTLTSSTAETTDKRRDIEEMRQRSERPNKGYHDIPLLSVGKQVRVQTKGRRRTALIECVNESEGTVEVLYCGLGDRQDGEQEEEVVNSAVVEPLQDFESQPSDIRRQAYVDDLYGAVAAAKEDANALFKLQDYEEAAQLYSSAIDQLRHFRAPKSGSECWVLMNHGGALVLGCVRSVDADSEKAEIALYRPDVDQLQIFSGAPWRVLIPVHEDQLTLHSSLYTNRAKSLVQLGCHQEAAQDLTVAIGLWAARDEGARRGGGRMARPLSHAEIVEQQEQLTKAYYLRAKTRLARLKLGPARGDLNEALVLQPPAAMMGLLQQLKRDIDVAEKEQATSNKRIAKEVAKWADKALMGLDGGMLLALDQRFSTEDGSCKIEHILEREGTITSL